MKWSQVPKRPIYAACFAILGGDYIFRDADFFVKSKIRDQFKLIKERQDQEAKTALQGGVVVPHFPSIHLDKERDDVFASAKDPFKSINVVFGPANIGKTVAMQTLAEKQASAGRKVLYLPIGKVGSDSSTANTSLTSDVLKALNVPERRSVLGYLCQPVMAAYCSFMKIPYIAGSRVDYAFRMLSECMEDEYKNYICYMKEQRAYGYISRETIVDLDKGRPLLVIDEGHQNYDGTWKHSLPVNNSVYDAEKTELTHKLLQEVFVAHSKDTAKSFEVWVTGHDNKLIEECVAKYKRSSPCVTYVLQDSLIHSGFQAHLNLLPRDSYRNPPKIVRQIETVYGNRMLDVVHCLAGISEVVTGIVNHSSNAAANLQKILTDFDLTDCEVPPNFQSDYEFLTQYFTVSNDDVTAVTKVMPVLDWLALSVIINQQETNAEADLEELLATCESDDVAVAQLKTALTSMAKRNTNTTNVNGIRNCNAVALTSLPECVKQSPAFERVFFSVLGQVNFSRPVYKYCWRNRKFKQYATVKGWLW